MRLSKWAEAVLAVAIVACLLCCTVAQAEKGGGGGDRGKGGGGGYILVPLSDDNGNYEVASYATGANEVWIDGEFSGLAVVGNVVGSNAYYWMLNAGGSVVETTALPMPVNSAVGDIAAAHDINDQGMIVGGGGSFIPLVLRPLFWLDNDTPPVELPIPDDHTGVAVDINNNGMIVGQLKNLDSTQLAVVWQYTGTITDDETGQDIPTFAGPLELAEETTVWAPRLNDAGTVVVTSAYEGLRWDVTWDGTDLTASTAEPLTGIILDESGDPRDVILRSTGINELGDVCGEYVAVGGGLWGTFLLLSDGTLDDLPTPESKRFGPRNNGAYDLNDAVDPAAIQIVGNVHLFDKRSGILTDDMPVVWQGGAVTDLESATAQGTPKLRLSGINKVSNNGWLSGFGEDPDTSIQYGVVLVPQ